MALKGGGRCPQQPVPKVSPVPMWPDRHSPVAPIRQALLLTCGAAEPALGADGVWCGAGQEALGPELVLPQVSVGLRTAWLGPGCCRSQGPESAGNELDSASILLLPLLLPLIPGLG